MNIDLGSFAFGSYLNSGVGTPSWGTALGQSSPYYKFTYPGSEVLLIGMVYCSVPLENVQLPLGRGGRVFQASEHKDCQLASLFRKVYINGVKIDYPFIMVLIKEDSASHSGRRSIKYSDKITYESDNEEYSNQVFIQEARYKLGLDEDACWFVYSFEVYNQDELHMSAVIVDHNNSVEYENSSVRRNEWLDMIPEDKEFVRSTIPRIIEAPNNLQIIYYGAPGTGKSFTIKEQTEGKDVIRTTFHPDSDYSTFVGCYKPTSVVEKVMTVIGTKAVPVENQDGSPKTETKIIYEFVSQAFLQAYIAAWQKLADSTDGEPQKQYLVIEEINRGNCAQIFGDLFQLLDRNEQGFSEYPIKADSDMKKQLKKHLENLTIDYADSINALYNGEDIVKQVFDGDILLLPNNLFIWATMNTSDQSLFPIDSAFKRRWDWQYIPISNAHEEWAIDVNGKHYDWWDFLAKINALIGETTNSEDKKLGYYFCKTQNGIIDAKAFVGKVIFYLWNDVFKDFEFDGDVFLDSDGTSKLTFDKFYLTDANGKAVVNQVKADIFLSNLKVKVLENEDEEFITDEGQEDTSQDAQQVNNTNGRNLDHSKYSINGNGAYKKGPAVLESVRLFTENNPEMTAEEVVNAWLALGIKVKDLIETEARHEQRRLEANDVQFDRRSNELTLNNGERVFISNQFTPQRISDFIEKVNAQDWGIEIAKL